MGIETVEEEKVSTESPRVSQKKRVSFADGKLPGLPDNGFGSLMNSVEDVGNNEEARITRILNLAQLFPKEKWTIAKNLTLLCIGATCYSAAYRGALGLQDLNQSADRLRIGSYGGIYAALVLSSMLLPTLVIKRFSCKAVVTYSMVCVVLYVAALVHPRVYVMAPVAILLGLAMAAFWVSVCTYVAQLSGACAKVTQRKEENVVGWFFGFLFSGVQSSRLWVDLIFSSFFRNSPSSSFGNNSYIKEPTCGIGFCPGETTFDDVTRQPSVEESRTLITIYVGCAAVALFAVTVFLDPLSRYGERKWKSEDEPGPKVPDCLIAALLQMKKPKQLLLIPVTLFTGMVEAFVEFDVSQAYVLCGTEMQSARYLTICCYAASIVSSLLFGLFSFLVGRTAFLIFCSISQGALMAFMILWQSTAESTAVLYAVSGLWGGIMALWKILICVLYGIYFSTEREAAYSNLCLWESVGFISMYASSATTCVDSKLYILLAMLGVSVLSYALLKAMETKVDEDKSEPDSDKENTGPQE